MALRIGLLKSSALQNDGRIKPVILQCRTPQETNPKGQSGPNCFFCIKSLCLLPPCTQSWYTQSYDLLNLSLREPEMDGAEREGGRKLI